MGLMYQTPFIGFIASDDVEQRGLSEPSVEFFSDIKYIIKGLETEDEVVSCFDDLDVDAVDSNNPGLLIEFGALIQQGQITIERPYHSHGAESAIFKLDFFPSVPDSELNYAWDISDLKLISDGLSSAEAWIIENTSPELSVVLNDLVKLSFVSSSD